jgi:glycosyltransferase involved in cell wall biosynthesis
MDVAVVPYQPIEDFFFSPMKLFESMAAGRPTVAAELGQITEVVRDGQTGLLYPPGDQQRLAQAINRLLGDTRLASRIGAAAREYVLQHHTWRHVTSEVVRIARKLLQT